VLVRDVTDLRRRERALLGKDATIREIHHRVKNNLQTVAALLRLQARRMPSAEAGEVVPFDEVADRIVAMVADTASALGGGRLVRRGEIGELPSERATPLAMVLTELLMNAVEHGLGGPGREGGGEVVLRATRTPDRLRLDVDDDGAGLAEASIPTMQPRSVSGCRSWHPVVDELGGTLRLLPAPTGRAPGPARHPVVLTPSPARLHDLTEVVGMQFTCTISP
jgi:two-component sensor histidine kinase